MMRCALVFFVIFSVARGMAQASGSGRLQSFREALQAKNIGTDEASLIRAMKNDDAGVRSLAALELAEERAIGATPEISAALKTEVLTSVRINLALALAQLGDDSGRVELDRIQAADSVPVALRIEAVRGLLALGSRSGANTLLGTRRFAARFSGYDPEFASPVPSVSAGASGPAASSDTERTGESERVHAPQCGRGRCAWRSGARGRFAACR